MLFGTNNSYLEPLGCREEGFQRYLVNLRFEIELYHLVHIYLLIAGENFSQNDENAHLTLAGVDELEQEAHLWNQICKSTCGI